MGKRRMPVVVMRWRNDGWWFGMLVPSFVVQVSGTPVWTDCSDGGHREIGSHRSRFCKNGSSGGANARAALIPMHGRERHHMLKKFSVLTTAGLLAIMLAACGQQPAQPKDDPASAGTPTVVSGPIQSDDGDDNRNDDADDTDDHDGDDDGQQDDDANDGTDDRDDASDDTDD